MAKRGLGRQEAANHKVLLRDELSKYTHCTGDVGASIRTGLEEYEATKAAGRPMPGYRFWKNYCHDLPLLQELAIRVS